MKTGGLASEPDSHRNAGWLATRLAGPLASQPPATAREAKMQLAAWEAEMKRKDAEAGGHERCTHLRPHLCKARSAIDEAAQAAMCR